MNEGALAVAPSSQPAHSRARASRGAVPRWWPVRWYYGWAIVGTLGITAAVSYGILTYALTAFVLPMSQELGWSTVQVTGAFSVAQLVAGLAAIPVGRWVDRHGTRALMTAGALLVTVLLLTWAHVRTLAGLYFIFAVMGVAMAAVLYEPAFAAIATWFRRGRSRALTVLTVLGGLASVIFVPLATTLVAQTGWRATLLVFMAIHVAFVLIPHAVVLRRAPADLGLLPDGEDSVAAISPVAVESRHATASVAVGSAHHPVASAAPLPPPSLDDMTTRSALRARPFRLLTGAFALSAFGSTALAVHLVPLLVERGHGMTEAGQAVGILGLMALPGRVIFTPLGARVSRGVVTAALFLLQALALAVLLLTRAPWTLWAFSALFGAGFGAITPARAALLAETFGATNFGAIAGAMALVLALSRAAGPIGASVLLAEVGGAHFGYDAVLVVLLLTSLLSAAAVVVATGGRRASLRGATAPARSSSTGDRRPRRCEDARAEPVLRGADAPSRSRRGWR